MEMKYKALMLDVDGTVIPYIYDAIPTTKVKEAIHKAIKVGVHVCLVTGRSHPSTTRILHALGISKGYIVVDGGALVYDLEKEKPLYQQYLADADIRKIITIFQERNIPFYIKDKEGLKQRGDNFELYKNGDPLTAISMIFTQEEFSLDETHAIMKLISSPTINIVRSRHAEPDKYSFNITHAKATKLHGIEKLQKILGLKREEIIGAGDGYNDFPLLMASGLKIAMGNAVEDLKEIADYIAPSVDKDGVADIIERFVTMEK